MKFRTVIAALGLGLFGLGLGWFAPGFSQPAHAQRGGVVELPIRVNAGDTFDLTVDTRTVEATTGQSVHIRIVLGLTVEEMGPEGGVWRWSFEDLSLIEMSGAPELDALMADAPLGPGFDQAMSAAFRLMTDLDFVCRVNAQGACVELLNWGQWRERIENTVLLTSGAVLMVDAYQDAPTVSGSAGMDALQLALGGGATAPAADVPAGPDMAMIAAAIDTVSGVILDAMDARMVGAMFAMPVITDVQGLALREDQSQPTETLIPLPFGATPLRYSGTVTLDDVDRRDGVARFTRTATLDPDSVTMGLTTLMQNGSAPIISSLLPVLPEGTMGEDPQASAEFMASMVGAMMASFAFTLEETGTVEVDLNTGLVRSGTVTQVLTMAGPDGMGLANQTSTTTFTLTPVAPRGPRLGAAATVRE